MPEEIIKGAPSGAITISQNLEEEITVGTDATIAGAVAAAEAEMKARILVARKFRRDVDVFREGLLKTCRRPSFAEIALFDVPRAGKHIIDFSIRFVEAAIQEYEHVFVTSRVIGQNRDSVKLSVQIYDAQKNFGYYQEAEVEKSVERKDAQGRRIIAQRLNSYGDLVYLVEANKDELRNLLGAERSKLIRDNGKRLLPRDILDEARAVIDRVLKDETAKDPDSAKRKILDRFAGLGISAGMLKEYLGVPIETLKAPDLAELGVLYNGLKESTFSWADVMRMKDAAAEGEPESKPPQHGLKERVQQQASLIDEEKQ